MQSVVFDYLSVVDEFTLFGLTHWVAIILFTFLVFWLPWYAKTRLNDKWQRIIAYVMTVLIFLNYPIWVLLEILGGSFDIKLHLPFHLCRLANLLIPLVLIKRNNFIFQILYFWGLSGMLQAIISPDIVHDFPHFHYFRFFIGHNLMVVALIYAVVVFKMKPTIKGLKYAFVGLNIFLILSFIINLSIDANYFWIMGKPTTGSLLDFMGPWPWYIFVGEFVALAHFVLAFLLYKFFFQRKFSHA